MPALSSQSPRSYGYSPAGLAAVQRRLSATRNIVFTGVLLIAFAMDLKTEQNWRNGPLTTLIPHVLILTFVFVVLFVAFRRATLRQLQVLSSYELLLGSDFVLRRVSGQPELEFRREEVTAIREYRNGLLLQTASPQLALSIPDSLDEFAEIRDRLGQWMPLSPGPSAWARSPYFLPVLLVAELIFLGAFFLSNRSLVEVITGVPLVVGVLWALVKLQSNKQLMPALKRGLWIMVLPLAAIAARLILAILHWR